MSIAKPLPLYGQIQQTTNWWHFSQKTGLCKLHFMQIIALGDILHEMSKSVVFVFVFFFIFFFLFFWFFLKKNTSIRLLLRILPTVFHHKKCCFFLHAILIVLQQSQKDIFMMNNLYQEHSQIFWARFMFCIIILLYNAWSQTMFFPV